MSDRDQLVAFLENTQGKCDYCQNALITKLCHKCVDGSKFDLLSEMTLVKEILSHTCETCKFWNNGICKTRGLLRYEDSDHYCSDWEAKPNTYAKNHLIKQIGDNMKR